MQSLNWIYVVMANSNVVILRLLLWFSLGTKGVHFIQKMQTKYRIAYSNF